MFDSAMARRMMVDGQVRTADVTNPDLIAAMLEVPREQFVPPALATQAYVDSDLEIGGGRALLKPMVLARLIQAAQVHGSDQVLDVGCGMGYSSAVLSRMVGWVIAQEQEASLARAAREALASVGASNVSVVEAPLVEGWPAAAPYDVILLNGSSEITLDVFGAQLKPDGRLACIFGRPPNAKAMLFRLAEGRLVGRWIFDASAQVLPGFVAPPAFVF